MDPTVLEMVVPAVKVRGRKGKAVPILPVAPDVPLEPAKAIGKNLMPNAKKEQAISMKSAVSLPGDKIYDAGERMAKVRAAKKSSKPITPKKVEKEEKRVTMEAHHLKEGKSALHYDKEGMTKHIAHLRAEHKKQLAGDIAMYRHEMRMMRKAEKK